MLAFNEQEDEIEEITDQEALTNLKWQISHGMDVNALNINEETPLGYALENHWPQCARYLIEHGAGTPRKRLGQ